MAGMLLMGMYWYVNLISDQAWFRNDELRVCDLVFSFKVLAWKSNTDSRLRVGQKFKNSRQRPRLLGSRWFTMVDRQASYALSQIPIRRM